MRTLRWWLLTGLTVVVLVSSKQENLGGQPEMADSVQAHQPSQHSAPSVWMVHHQLVSKIRGMSAENLDGQHLGRVENFILDARSSEVRYVVISYGGWVGVGKKLKAVPAKIASTATAKQGVLAVDAGHRRWERAPVFKRSDLLYFNTNPSAAEAIDGYYSDAGLSAEDSPSAGFHRIARQAASLPRGATRDSGLVYASEVLGKEVDGGGGMVGQVSDLLIDITDHRPTLAIVDHVQGLKATGPFAVRLSSLKRQTGGKFSLEATRESFTEAPPLDDNTWEGANKTEAIIYKYPKADNATKTQNNALENR